MSPPTSVMVTCTIHKARMEMEGWHGGMGQNCMHQLIHILFSCGREDDDHHYTQIVVISCDALFVTQCSWPLLD